MRRDDVYFSMMPMFHAGGSIYGLMSMLPIGGTLVFTEAFNAELAVRLIAEEQATRPQPCDLCPPAPPAMTLFPAPSAASAPQIRGGLFDIIESHVEPPRRGRASSVIAFELPLASAD